MCIIAFYRRPHWFPGYEEVTELLDRAPDRNYRSVRSHGNGMFITTQYRYPWLLESESVFLYFLHYCRLLAKVLIILQIENEGFTVPIKLCQRVRWIALSPFYSILARGGVQQIPQQAGFSLMYGIWWTPLFPTSHTIRMFLIKSPFRVLPE